MGQRHQVFVIARVRPHGAPPDHPGTRRCIAALHHQWCYGTVPLRAMRRLITLVSQPDNATIVRAEVRGIQGKYGGPEVDPKVPCPFIATLLWAAWAADLQEGSFYASSGILLAARMGCWDGDNDDGLSILDVTDPEKPSYCFLSDDERLSGQENAPIDAQTYLSLYYDPNGKDADDEEDSLDDDEDSLDDEEDSLDDEEETLDDNAKDDSEAAEQEHQWQESLRKAVEALKDVPILPVSWLREAWPYERFRDTLQSAPSDDTKESQATSEVSYGIPTVPNLADMSLDVAVKQSIDDGDTTAVEQLLWLPGKAARVKVILRTLNPFPDSAVHLLSITLKELKETFRIELTGFALSGAQVATVLYAHDEVRYVDLSDNAVIVADDVPDIITAAPSVRRIVLMECPSVDGARLLELARTQPSLFKSIEGILHPAFFLLENPDDLPFAFTYVSITPGSHTFGGDQSCVSIPFFTPAQVVQAVTDVIPWQSGLKSDRMRVTDKDSPTALAAFQGGLRLPGQSANERTVMTVPHSFKEIEIPRGQDSLWTFVCKMPSYYSSDKANKGWAFVHYTTNNAEGTADGAYSCKVYDLRGFLQSMAQEERPMPSDEAVEMLEKVLYLKDEETGEYCCPVMKQDEAPQAALE